MNVCLVWSWQERVHHRNQLIPEQRPCLVLLPGNIDEDHPQHHRELRRLLDSSRVRECELSRDGDEGEDQDQAGGEKPHYYRRSLNYPVCIILMLMRCAAYSSSLPCQVTCPLSSLHTVMHDNITAKLWSRETFIFRTNITSSPFLHNIAVVDGRGLPIPIFISHAETILSRRHFYRHFSYFETLQTTFHLFRIRPFSSGDVSKR